MPVEWFRIDTTAPFHRKQLAAGPAACWLWACGLGYCRRLGTDGFIPDAAVPMLGVGSWKRLAGCLVSAGLWERTEGGYHVHDFGQSNTSSEERDREKAMKAERNARYQSGLKTKNKTRLKTVDDERLKTTQSREEESREEEKHTPKPPEGARVLAVGGAQAQRFQRWYASYPNRVGRGAAWREWQRIKPAPDEALLEQMLAAVTRQIGSDRWQRGFIPNPSTWLHQQRWLDETDSQQALVDAELERFRPKGA